MGNDAISVAEELALKKTKSKNNNFYPVLMLSYYAIICEYGFSTARKIDKNISIRLNTKYLKSHNRYASYVTLSPINDFDNFTYSSKNSRGYLFLNDTFNNGLLLSNTLHEMNHARKSIINKYDFINVNEKKIMAVRSGMSYTAIVKKKKEQYIIKINYGLEEAFNVLDTNDMLKFITNAPSNLFDRETRNFLENINYNLLKDYSYKELATSFKNLWNDNSFKRVIKGNSYTGDIDSIIDYINITSGDINQFDKLANLADNLYSFYEDDFKYKTYYKLDKINDLNKEIDRYKKKVLRKSF